MIPGTSAAINKSLSFLEGEQWGGIPAFSVTVLGVPPSDDAASVIMQFSRRVPFVTLTSGAGEITITSASGWTFEVPAQTIDLKAGDYTWAIQVTDVNGAALTYLQGTMTVLPPAIIAV